MIEVVPEEKSERETVFSKRLGFTLEELKEKGWEVSSKTAFSTTLKCGEAKLSIGESARVFTKRVEAAGKEYEVRVRDEAEGKKGKRDHILVEWMEGAVQARRLKVDFYGDGCIAHIERFASGFTRNDFLPEDWERFSSVVSELGIVVDQKKGIVGGTTGLLEKVIERETISRARA